MATTSSKSSDNKTPETASAKRISKKRIAVYALLALIGAALIWFIANFSNLQGTAKVGTSYAAHITCSCRYIEGRSADDCAKDMEPGTEIVSISDDPDNKRVTATVALLAESVAEKRGKFGCINLNEAEIDALN